MWGAEDGESGGFRFNFGGDADAVQHVDEQIGDRSFCRGGDVAAAALAAGADVVATTEPAPAPAPKHREETAPVPRRLTGDEDVTEVRTLDPGWKNTLRKGCVDSYVMKTPRYTHRFYSFTC